MQFTMHIFIAHLVHPPFYPPQGHKLDLLTLAPSNAATSGSEATVKTSEGRSCFFVLQSEKLVPRPILDQLPIFLQKDQRLPGHIYYFHKAARAPSMTWLPSFKRCSNPLLPQDSPRIQDSRSLRRGDLCEQACKSHQTRRTAAIGNCDQRLAIRTLSWDRRNMENLPESQQQDSGPGFPSFLSLSSHRFLYVDW